MDIPEYRPRKTCRNPLIYARELNEELVRDSLTRKQLARLYGVSSDRITQWLCLLKRTNRDDHWSRLIISERKLRKLRE